MSKVKCDIGSNKYLESHDGEASHSLTVRVFLSYAHPDERLRQALEKHLSALRRSNLIDMWHDRCLKPGTEYEADIDSHLEAADLVILLISPDFVTSNYCYQREMQLALKRHASKKARVVPVVLRPVDWLETPIGTLLSLPRDGKPITTWSIRDEALLNVAVGIRHVVNAIVEEKRARVSSHRPL